MAVHSNDKFRRRALAVEEARQSVLHRVGPLGSEELDLQSSIGRRLAKAVFTLHPLPHFRRSGMDGYAVRSEDLAHACVESPIALKVLEHIPCGEVPKQPIVSGTASRIMTGAMVPEGADAVIMLEMTDTVMRDGLEQVRIRKSIQEGTNVTPIGEEAQCGEQLLEAGSQIRAGEAAILAALGCGKVSVFRQPKVTVISTGSELLDVSEPIQMGKIRNSNSYMLAAQIRQAGGIASIQGNMADDRSNMERILHEVLSSDADVVITTGGVSVGDYDTMADIFLNWEGETLFNKLAMRPGSPTSAGVWGDKLLFGLSGNPAACFVGFELLIRPALLKMQGADEPLGCFTAFLEEDYLKVNAFTRYVRGVRSIREGKVYVRPVGIDKSSVMTSLKDADCLIIIPPTKTGFRAGDMVQAIMVSSHR